MPLDFNAKPTFDHPAVFVTMGSKETFAAGYAEVCCADKAAIFFVTCINRYAAF